MIEAIRELREDGYDGAWLAFNVVGVVVAGITSVAAFFAIYIAAVVSVGWVIGIALGWIPALLGACVAAVIGRYLWWLAPLLLVGLFWY